MLSEPFWKTDPAVLINPKYIHRFYPSNGLTTAERLNSIVRLGGYIGIGLVLVRKELSWIFLPVFCALVTMIWNGTSNESFTSRRSDKDFIYLANQIKSGKIRHKKRKKKHDRLYNDLDANMDSLRNERAKMNRSIDTGVSDAPGFARSIYNM